MTYKNYFVEKVKDVDGKEFFLKYNNKTQRNNLLLNLIECNTSSGANAEDVEDFEVVSIKEREYKIFQKIYPLDKHKIKK